MPTFLTFPGEILPSQMEIFDGLTADSSTFLLEGIRGTFCVCNVTGNTTDCDGVPGIECRASSECRLLGTRI